MVALVPFSRVGFVLAVDWSPCQRILLTSNGPAAAAHPGLPTEFGDEWMCHDGLSMKYAPIGALIAIPGQCHSGLTRLPVLPCH